MLSPKKKYEQAAEEIEEAKAKVEEIIVKLQQN